eukprot:CAMPEP_0194399310 /NCGR_PEP_ID=MMETSP0174-20130528/126590_1 /TAXON_ID=216777 /ORGANISM="Proboscia alata, Strain PI-D3" /LENGTH=482 /DNA_ID=CAMNT_0039195707 /DNA_START=1 /DNA_END=1446 /DNA_ORIENTATION=+
MIICGPKGSDVAAQCALLSSDVASLHTRIRKDYTPATPSPLLSSLDLDALGGRVLLGISHINNTKDNYDTYVARFMAESNEDMYRVLHHCLLPLSTAYFGGIDFYGDRIQSSTSVCPSNTPINKDALENKNEATSFDSLHHCLPPTNSQSNIKRISKSNIKTSSGQIDYHYKDSDHGKTWSAYMLADSGLPTGGFSHSSGIEAASQLSLFGENYSGRGTWNEASVRAFVCASARSAAQLSTAFVLAGHEIAIQCKKSTVIQCNSVDPALSNLNSVDPALSNLNLFMQKWKEIDEYNHAIIASNTPGCRASLDQGAGMLRVSIHWLRNKVERKEQYTNSTTENFNNDILALEFLEAIQKHGSGSEGYHIGAIFGIITSFLNLSGEEACHILGYCAARDMVSTSVRLNLVGPLAAVGMLDELRVAVKDGIAVTLNLIESNHPQDGVVKGIINDDPLACLRSKVILSASSSCPIIDTIHPCHDLL